MPQMQLWIFWAIVTAFIVCGCILTRKPTKRPPTETVRPAVPDEHQPGCFALEEERGGNWKGSGRLEPKSSQRARLERTAHAPTNLIPNFAFERHNVF
jgi:hypothetical protein